MHAGRNQIAESAIRLHHDNPDLTFSTQINHENSFLPAEMHFQTEGLHAAIAPGETYARFSSTLDYWNVFLTRLPGKHIKLIQLIHNAAARNQNILLQTYNFLNSFISTMTQRICPMLVTYL